MKKYDCVIVGGGIAGLQAAIQLGRYNHRIVVVDSDKGRSNLSHCYHNILGWPEGVSGQELRSIGNKQAMDLGVTFMEDLVVDVAQTQGKFIIKTTNMTIEAASVLLATGVVDRIPPKFLPLFPCLGLSVFICPDCDGHEVKNKRTLVFGTGNPGAHLAMALTYWTNELIFINHEQRDIDEELMEQLNEKNVTYICEPVEKVLCDGHHLHGVILKNGTKVTGSYAFLAFGGNKVKSELARGLGVELFHNKHILSNPRTKMTNIEGVWAAGDVAVHSEQVAIAMGDGHQAAIWIHKYLLEKK